VYVEFRFELFTGQNRTRQLAEIREHEAHDVTALATAVKLSSERYVAGKASYYEVLEAQQQLFPSQINLARTQRDQLLAVQRPGRRLAG
jgi:multidrug efflux system outer membrane protein